MPALAHPFDAVIFDMDGTLLDTESVFRSIVFDVCAELGYEMRDEVHLRIVGSSHEATEKMLVETFGVAFPYTLFDEKCRSFMHDRTKDEGVPVKAGARELITALKDRDIPVAVATSSRKPHATRHLSHAGLFELFDTIVTRDDVANPKPHPEPYLTAARRLNARPAHCIAFEDSHSGVRAAHAAGMRTVMVPDLVGPTEEIAALCAAVLDSLVHAHDEMFLAS
ncbi:HAD family hydrolase [Pelagibacterium xiamenense]|uniref:HAD family hydrolase n=1 Tax=Pelagibacterium xiamenense TaxID=2901140 RepID=UPI001E587AEC|nr:HAD family phosphatase [Pelagibacterium xiamenense]MCD7058600.1 HAD family phosphatase [Pelagibacterium xiamenense]